MMGLVRARAQDGCEPAAARRSQGRKSRIGRGSGFRLDPQRRSVCELKTCDVDREPLRMRRQLARRRPVSVAALEAWPCTDGLQFGSLDAGDQGGDQISNPASQRAREAAGQDGLIGKTDSRFVLCRNRHSLEPHRGLDPAELVQDLGWLGGLDLEAFSPARQGSSSGVGDGASAFGMGAAWDGGARIMGEGASVGRGGGRGGMGCVAAVCANMIGKTAATALNSIGSSSEDQLQAKLKGCGLSQARRKPQVDNMSQDLRIRSCSQTSSMEHLLLDRALDLAGLNAEPTMAHFVRPIGGVDVGARSGQVRGAGETASPPCDSIFPTFL